MKTSICPTCGCSLIRLGITKENSITQIYDGKEYFFCCDGCAELFRHNPQVLLSETSNIVVCPSCLAEKPIHQTVELEYNGEKFNFCRCPHCMDVFQKDPEYFIKRLLGQIDFAGVFSAGNGCCS